MQARFLLLPVAVGLAVAAPPIEAQTLGDTGAASAISGSMSGAGQGGTMAVGSRAASDARRLGQNPYIGGGQLDNRQMMGEGGPPAAYGAGAPGGYPGGSSGGPPAGYPGGSSGGYPGAPGGAPGGEPGFPDPTGAGGAGAVQAPRKEPIRWGKETGEGFLAELRSRPTRAVGVGRKPPGTTARASRMTPKQLARLPRSTRTKLIRQKYKKPPVGYLSYYLPEDRYKLTSGLWKYVTIEDDRARYPVRHYFRPDSPRFLSIVSQKARGTQARFNRVIGFASWQEALIAGYRPDPVSKPSPGVELATIASIAPAAEAARYAEFLYAGQIAPDEFRRTFGYIQRVRGVINRRADTRRYLRPTVGQILLAALGEGTIPRSVGGPPRAVVTTAVGPAAPGNYPGAGGSGYPGGGSSGYPGSSSSGYPGSGGSGSGGYPGSGYPGGGSSGGYPGGGPPSGYPGSGGPPSGGPNQ